jgi:ribosomal protein S18 acetylase RimI-like enzyme
MEITIEQLKTFPEEVTENINSLLEQLNPDAQELSVDDCKRIIENESNYFLVAKESLNRRIVGMLTFIVLNAPSGRKGLLEDLVVDKNYRGKGIGAKLINEAISKARNLGILHIDFTSNPKRVEANKLYEHLGFEKRDTNVYRIDL